MIQRLRERWPWLDTTVRVHQRVGAIDGGTHASSIALAAFLSLFPLVLVAIAVVGFLSAGDTTFTADLVDDLGLEGQAADFVTDAVAAAESSRRAATVVGFAGLVWSGLGVVSTLQAGLNAAWQTPSQGLRGRLAALVWLAGAGVLLLVTLAIGSLLSFVPGVLAPVGIAVGLGLNVVLALWTFHALGARLVPWRAHLPGAIVGGIGFEVLKLVGTVYVPRLVASSSGLYGSVGVVFALLAWLLLYGRLLIYAMCLNVVRHEDRFGTLTVEIEVPRMGDGAVPLAADRGGAVRETRAEG